MRLTHAITMHDDNRVPLKVTVIPDAELAITLEQDPGVELSAASVYLSFDQYDVISELVNRVRPELPEGSQTHHVPNVAYEICTVDGDYGRCVMAGIGDHPRHINAGGRDVHTGKLL